MADHELGDATSFKELERQGWGEKAGDYNAFAGQVTVGAAEPLLDAVGVRAGMRVLDVATGPGYVAAGRAMKEEVPQLIDKFVRDWPDVPRIRET